MNDKRMICKAASLFLTVILLFSCFTYNVAFAQENIASKVYCTATLDDEFSDNKVIVVINPKNNFDLYNTANFADIGCIAIKDLSVNVQEGELSRILSLTLEINSKKNVLYAIKILETRSDIYSAEPNYIKRLCEEPNDDKYVADKQWAIDQISLPDAWDITTGSSTVYVGVIDTGIDATHPDLVNRVDTELSQCFSSDFDTALEDDYGHGTKVAGVIGAESDNLIGITGTCWNIRIVSLRAVKANGFFDNEAVLAAIQYAENNDISILNFSGGGGGDSYRVSIQSYSGLFVCSAGNENNDNDVTPHYPSDYNDLPNVISVGASNKYDKQWTYTDDEGVLKGSNYGITKVDLFAPGASVYTTHVDASYGRSSGTSIAAPYVAGVAALLLSKYPTISAAHMKYCIMIGVDIITDSNGDSVFGELCVSGGRLNAYKALTLAEDHYAHAYTVYRYYSPIKHVRTCTICNADEYAHHSAAALMQSAW